MSILSWIILGLLAGTIAKAIMRGGNEPQGWIATIILGIVGALLGGWIGSVLFNVDLNGFFNIWTWLLAIGGSCLALLIYGALTKRRAA